MNVPLVLGLLGAAGYPMWKQIEAGRDNETYTGKGLGLLAASGGAAGWTAGGIIQTLASMIRQRKMRKVMESQKPGTRADIARLLNQKEFRNIPAYQQIGGKDMDNAYYADSASAMALADPAEWKDLRTGKAPREFKDKAIWIGKKFNHTPIVAHELGHAHDLRNTSRAANIGLALLGMAGTAAAFGGGLATNKYAEERNFDAALGSAAVMAAGLGSVALTNHIVKKRERAASDIAMQVLARMGNKGKKLEDADKLLQSAYATYDPIQFSQPEFGSGEYGQLN